MSRKIGAREKKPSRVPVRIPVEMLDGIKNSMSIKGYGKKEQSAWLSEALIALLKIENTLEIVREEFINPGEKSQVFFILNGTLLEEINRCLAENTDLNISNFIRAAINHRLFQEQL